VWVTGKTEVSSALHPLLVVRTTVSYPIPEYPPVTIATLPVRSAMSLSGSKVGAGGHAWENEVGKDMVIASDMVTGCVVGSR
jgi:hypothetical protein